MVLQPTSARRRAGLGGAVRAAAAGIDDRMERRQRSPAPTETATLGATLRAHFTLIVNCHECSRQVRPDVAVLVAAHGPDLTLPDWGARLVCSACGSRDVDFVLSASSNQTGIRS
jgi:hypothetical protein